MSDNEYTPRQSARVNSERFDTELAAVWYAANYYYETSYRKGREYIGVVFREADGKFGLTVRGDGWWCGAKVNVLDVPENTIPVAVWHTHIPSISKDGLSIGEQFFIALMTSFDIGLEDFSTDDKNIVNDISRFTTRLWGHRISIYLITHDMIKRYKSSDIPETTWKKEPPAGWVRHMQKKASSQGNKLPVKR